MFDDKERVSFYYKPVTSFIGIRAQQNVDNPTRFHPNFISFIPDRVCGGTSRKEGSLELMLERKINGVDSKGVN